MGMSRSKFTSTDIDNAVRRYQAGETQKQIAEAFGITQTSVGRWLKSRGVTVDRAAISRRVYERMTPAERAKFRDAPPVAGTTPWTDDEIGFLLENPDMPSHQVGAQLGRGAGSAQRMRLKLANGWSPVQQRFTESEDQVILDRPTWSASQIAQALGRSLYSIEHRRKLLSDRGHVVSTTHGNSSPFRPGARPIIAKTCPDCGLLLQSHWFTVVSGAWRRRCTRCHDRYYAKAHVKQDKAKHAAANHRTHAKYQQLTVDRAENNGQPWCESEMAVLADVDLTHFQKALILKRTYASVQQAVRKHGFRSRIGLGDPERDQWIIDNPNLASDGTLLVSVAPIPEPAETEQRHLEPMWA